MARKGKSDKQKVDGDIIEYLMLAENEQSATDIAKAIGYKRAKAINSRLAALHTKSIINKIRYNKSVFWTIEQFEKSTNEQTATVTVTLENLSYSKPH